MKSWKGELNECAFGTPHHWLCDLRASGNKRLWRPPEFVKFSEGVKQGDPLSTLFFIAYINDLSAFLKVNGAGGVHLGNKIGEEYLLALFFADDTTLLASSLEDAQKQLDLLCNYCSLNGLEVNIGKTEWMGVHVSPTDSLHYREQKLNKVESFCLLGYYLTASGAKGAHVQGREVKVTKAYGVWTKVMRDYPGLLPKQSITFFNGLVNGASSYGNPFIAENPTDNKLLGRSDRDDTTRRALRYVLGAPTSTSIAGLFHLTGEKSLISRDHIAALNYWAQIRKKSALVQKAWNLLTARKGDVNANWAGYVRKLLTYYFGKVDGTTIWESGEMSLGTIRRTVEGKFKDLLDKELFANGKLAFLRSSGSRYGHHIALQIRLPDHRNAIARLLLSAHELEIEKGRHKNRETWTRTCIWDRDHADDEHHFLFDCSANTSKGKPLNVN